MKAKTRKPWLALNAQTYLVLSLSIPVLFFLHLSIGPASKTVFSLLPSLIQSTDDELALILLQIRLPRALLALLIGMGLGLSGACLQNLFRNPLAEPGIIGVSGCAALGATVVFYSGMSAWWSWSLPIAAIVGALMGVALLYLIAGFNHRLETLILAGVAINSLAGALTVLAHNLSPDPFAAYEMFFWLLGSLENRSMAHFVMAAPFIIAGSIFLFLVRRELDVLVLGDDVACSLGASLNRIRLGVIFGSALIIGASVAVAGIIGFVGLIVPHICRQFVGTRTTPLMLSSALAGGALLLLADVATRAMDPAAELKLGVVTALAGAPFFLFLVLRARQRD
ncbi:MAG: iron ABC transporter permease [Pseudomonadota bacterium]